MRGLIRYYLNLMAHLRRVQYVRLIILLHKPFGRKQSDVEKVANIMVLEPCPPIWYTIDVFMNDLLMEKAVLVMWR
jgi:hypothetical protein